MAGPRVAMPFPHKTCMWGCRYRDAVAALPPSIITIPPCFGAPPTHRFRYTHTCARTHTHTHTCAHMHACACTHTHMCTCMHTYTCTHVQPHTCARTHSHMHTHTWTLWSSWPLSLWKTCSLSTSHLMGASGPLPVSKAHVRSGFGCLWLLLHPGRLTGAPASRTEPHCQSDCTCSPTSPPCS